MDQVPDVPRTGYGLSKFRDRYIRRADHLLGQSQFIEEMTMHRQKWNERHPKYLLGVGDLATVDHGPQTLRADSERRRADREARDNCYPACSENHRVSERSREIMVAVDGWGYLILSLTETYFPRVDFYNPLDPGYAAAEFIVACLNGDPRLIRDSAQYFPPFQVEVEHVDQHEPSPEVYLPLYPGITINDLKASAVDIVTTVNQLYADKLPAARIIALRAEGMTHREIAARLGLTEQTVTATLKERGGPSGIG